MSLEDEFKSFALDSKQFQGKVLAWMDNTTDHIKAVSSKASEIREELRDHEKDVDAHGLGASGKTSSSIVAWGGLAVAILALFVPMLFALMKK